MHLVDGPLPHECPTPGLVPFGSHPLTPTPTTAVTSSQAANGFATLVLPLPVLDRGDQSDCVGTMTFSLPHTKKKFTLNRRRFFKRRETHAEATSIEIFSRSFYVSVITTHASLCEWNACCFPAAQRIQSLPDLDTRTRTSTPCISVAELTAKWITWWIRCRRISKIVNNMERYVRICVFEHNALCCFVLLKTEHRCLAGARLRIKISRSQGCCFQWNRSRGYFVWKEWTQFGVKLAARFL